MSDLRTLASLMFREPTEPCQSRIPGMENSSLLTRRHTWSHSVCCHLPCVSQLFQLWSLHHRHCWWQFWPLHPQLHLLQLPGCFGIFKPPTHPARSPPRKAKSPSSSRQSEQASLPSTVNYCFSFSISSIARWACHGVRLRMKCTGTEAAVYKVRCCGGVEASLFFPLFQLHI